MEKLTAYLRRYNQEELILECNRINVLTGLFGGPYSL